MRHIEFCVLSYAPRVVLGDGYAIGLLAFEHGEDGVRSAEARFPRDLEWLVPLDPNVDVEFLTALFRDIQLRLQRLDDATTLLNEMLDSFSNIIRISDVKTVMFKGDSRDEIDKLAALYISQPVGVRSTDPPLQIEK